MHFTLKFFLGLLDLEWPYKVIHGYRNL